MINREELTKNQDKIVAKFVVILASQEGWIVAEEDALKLDTPRAIRWRNTARSLFDTLLEMTAPACTPEDTQGWGGDGDFL